MEPDRRVPSGAIALGVLAALTLGRAALLAAIDLTPQEAYYFLYAEHPALSYFDHPPMIGWLLWLATAVAGKTVLGVRLVPLLGTLALQLAGWALVRELLPAGRRALAWLLLVTLPVTTGLSIMACPDVPLALFWTVALWALARAVFRGERAAWLAAGLAMGLAFDSKYVALALPFGLVLFLLLSVRHRALLGTPWPWVAVALSQIAALPVYWWNATHGWASFAYQSAYRVESLVRFDPASTLFVPIHQSALVGPVLFAGFLAAAWRGLHDLRGGRLAGEPRRLFLLAFSVPLLLVCLAASTVFWVKLNWLLPAYLAGVPLVAWTAGRRFVRWQLGWVALFHVFLVVELVLYPIPVEGDDTWFGWRELAAEVETVSAEHPGAFLFSVDSYKTAAELRFYLDRPVHGMNVIGYDAYLFDFLDEDPAALVGRDAILVDSDRRGRRSYPAEVAESFAEVEELTPIEIHHRGRVARRFFVSLCRGYRGPPPRAAPASG